MPSYAELPVGPSRSREKVRAKLRARERFFPKNVRRILSEPRVQHAISVVVDVNKLGRQLHLHDDQASGPLLLLPASICRSFPWLERLPQPARLDGLASQSRGCDALPYGHGGLLDAHFHRVPAEIDDGEHQSAASHLVYYHV